MIEILDKIEYNIENSSSIISFTTEGGGDWEIWDRYLMIDGKKAYHIGNICGTCSFFFERLGGANKHISAREVSKQLRSGLNSIESDLLDNIARIIPNGKYLVTLTKITPKMITLGGEGDYFVNEQVDIWGMDGFWGVPHYPKVQYYRGRTLTVQPGKTLFEFLVPMFPQNWLDKEAVNQYINLLEDEKTPTAITLSVLDIKQPGDFASDSGICPEHLCLAHYIVDGHHKIFAASQINKPITILSFIALEHGVSNAADVIDLYKG